MRERERKGRKREKERTWERESLGEYEKENEIDTEVGRQTNR